MERLPDHLGPNRSQSVASKSQPAVPPTPRQSAKHTSWLAYPLQVSAQHLLFPERGAPFLEVPDRYRAECGEVPQRSLGHAYLPLRTEQPLVLMRSVFCAYVLPFPTRDSFPFQSNYNHITQKEVGQAKTEHIAIHGHRRTPSKTGILKINLHSY